MNFLSSTASEAASSATATAATPSQLGSTTVANTAFVFNSNSSGTLPVKEEEERVEAGVRGREQGHSELKE